ncbi:MAG: hypothetical protein AB1437_21660 [Pseudomonadota bacterium]
MGGSAIDFFGDAEDHKRLFDLFDCVGDFVYVSTLSEVNTENKKCNNAIELASHLVTIDSPVRNSVFMIAVPSVPLIVREVEMEDGSGIKLFLHQALNPNAIEILLGGQAAQKTLVKTTLRTTGETPLSKDIYKKFKKVITSNTEKVGGYYYVAPNALVKLHEGWRLAPGLEYAEEADLKTSS